MPTGTMAVIPSVGDILMLSQTAWRMGRAFTQGTKSVPAEFAEVEREADRLSEAIRIVAETLNSNAMLLDQADDITKTALSAILNSAQRTLEDLESFVARYRIVKPHGERSWSDLVLENYKTIKWTTEGGSISGSSRHALCAYQDYRLYHAVAAVAVIGCGCYSGPNETKYARKAAQHYVR